MKKLNFNPFPVLETDRLTLRQLHMSDDEIIFRYQSDKENFKYVDIPIYTRIEEAQRYIVKMNIGVSENKWIIWAIADRCTNHILGTISIWNIVEEESKAELGYCLYPGNLGKGIMTETLTRVLEYGFDTLDIENIEAYTSASNVKSIRLLERKDFSRASSFIETETFGGEPMEMVIYVRKKQVSLR